jgi:hypothetical protein
MYRHPWRNLSNRERSAILVLGSIQLSLAATAWADLAARPAEEITGSKRTWALIIAINWIGPICYFRWGHQRSGPLTLGRRG